MESPRWHNFNTCKSTCCKFTSPVLYTVLSKPFEDGKQDGQRSEKKCFAVLLHSREIKKIAKQESVGLGRTQIIVHVLCRRLQVTTPDIQHPLIRRHALKLTADVTLLSRTSVRDCGVWHLSGEAVFAFHSNIRSKPTSAPRPRTGLSACWARKFSLSRLAAS